MNPETPSTSHSASLDIIRDATEHLISANVNLTDDTKLNDEEKTKASKKQSKGQSEKSLVKIFKDAVETNSFNIIELLLDQGLNVNAAFDISIYSGKETAINIVLDHGADVEEGLYFAVKANKPNVISLLLARGANINTNKRNGNTPLHAAIIQKCDAKFVEFLIDNGANVNARAKNNKTALDLARNCLIGKNDLDTTEKIKNVIVLLKKHTLSDNIFECLQGLPDGLSGYSYQIKLLTLYAIINTKLSMSTRCKYELGTEVKCYLPFDDIYLRKSHEGIVHCEFIQVKQTKKPEFNKIEQSNFFLTIKCERNIKEYLKGNDSIVKMFIKFDEITRNLNCKVFSDFVYCTNTTFKKSSSNCFVLADNVNDELLCSIGRQIWKIQDCRYLNFEIKFVLLNVIVMSPYFKTINEELKLYLNEQIKLLDNLKIEEIINKDATQEIWTVSQISKEGLNAVRDYMKILDISKLNIKSASNEKSIKDYLPEESELSNYAGDVALLKKKALAKLKEIYQSMKNDEELFLNFSKQNEVTITNKIDNFIKSFHIFTNCPTSDELDEIIIKEIHEEFKSPNSRFFADHCVQFFSKWVSNFKNERGNMFTDAYGKRLFHDLKAQTLMGFSKFYVEDLQKHNISFVQNSNDDEKFADLIKNETCKILHVVTNNVRLHALKFLQNFTQSQHSNFNLDNVLWTTLEFILKLNNATEHFFSTLSFDTNKNILIIEFRNISNEYGNLYEIINTLMKIVTKNLLKKIILIAPVDEKIVLDLKRLIKENYSFHSTVSFKDLESESQQIVMNKTVKFQHNYSTFKKHLKVKDFFKEATAIQAIDEDILSVIVTEKSSITISDGETDSNDLKEYYIPRRIRHQFIDKSDFTNIANHIIFVTGCSKAELISKLGSDYFVKSFEEGQRYYFGYIVMPDEDPNGKNKTEEEIFKRICDQSTQCLPLIWCELKDECFVWKRVNIWNADQTICLNELEVDIMNLDTYSFPPEDVEDKVVILANDPGEGKSTMLSQLREALKNKSPFTWIIRIDLRNYTDNIQKESLNYINFSETDVAKAAKAIALMVTEAKNDTTMKLKRSFIEAAINECSEIKVILLFDGFDEISPSYKEKTCTLLKALAKSNVKQIWVTTRIHLKSYLEAHLQVTAYKLTTLTNKEQLIFLNKFWKWNFKNYKVVQENVSDDTIITGIVNQLKKCYENCNKYIDDLDDFKSVIEYDHTNLLDLQECIDNKINMINLGKMLLTTWNYTVSDGGDFTTVPLNLEILARNIFERQWMISKATEINLFDMYTEFVDSKLSIFEHNKGKAQSINEVKKDQAEIAAVIYREMHREVAVKTIFESTSSLPDINVCSKYKNLNERLTRMGLMKSYGNRVEFVHRSYAEYFCSEYISIYLDNQNVQKELLMKILDNDEYYLMRNFFDGFLSRSRLLYTINKDKDVDINYSFKSVLIPSITEEIIKQKNYREQTVLHYAAYDGHMHIFKFVISELHQATIHKYNELFKVIMDCGNTHLKVKKELYIQTSKHFRKEETMLKRKLAFSTILKNVKVQVTILTFLAEQKNINDLYAFNLIEEIRKIIEAEKEHPDKFLNLITKCEKRKCATLHVTVWDLQNEISELTVYIGKDYLAETKKDQENISRTHKEAQNCIENNCNKILTISEKLSIVMLELTCKCNNKMYISMQKTVNMLQSEIFSAILNAINEYRDIKKGFLTQCGGYQHTPLHFAGLNGHRDLCKLIMLTAREYPDDFMNDFIMKRDDIQQTALHLASKRGHSEVCDLILKNAKKFPAVLRNVLTAYDAHDETALHLAARRNHVKVCSLLINTAIEYPDIIEILILKCDQIERTPLHVAAIKGHSNICILILETLKEYPNIIKNLATNCDRRKHTLLDTLARYGQSEAFHMLIKIINQYFPGMLMDVITKLDSNERACLDIAASYGHSELCDVVLKTLKEHHDIISEIITKVNINNNNILHLVANAGHEKVCDVILQAIRELPEVMKNVLTKQEWYKMTALHVAAKNGFVKICDVIMNNAKKYPHIIKEILTKCDSNNHNPLDVAVWYGHSEASEIIIKTIKGYPDMIKHFITKCDDINFTILHLAASNRNSAICKVVINNFIDYPENMKNLLLKCGIIKNTPLHLAAKAGHTDVCEVLIHVAKEYPDILSNFITKCDDYNQNALHLASKKGYGQTCNAILNAVKDFFTITNDLLTKCDDFGRTPLHIAAQRGHSEVCKVLIEMAEVNSDTIKNLIYKRDQNNRTAADLAESNGHNYIYDTIIKYTANENDSLLTGSNFELHALVWNVNCKLYNIIIESAGEYKDIIKNLIETCEWNKTTPLHLAAQKGLKDVCEIIITSANHYPDVMTYVIMKYDRSKQTALHVAAASGHGEVCELIINAAKEFPDTIIELISKRNRDDLTILHLAAQNGLSEVCNMIIDHVIENENIVTDLILKTDLKKRTPFHLASWYGKIEVCEIFIKTATKYCILRDLITMFDVNDQTALHLAASKCHTHICDAIIRSAKECPNTLEGFIMICDKNGQNILHLVARNGLAEICNTLLDCAKECCDNFGKNALTKSDVNKFTCLDIAAMYGHDEICEMIITTAKNYPAIMKDFLTKCGHIARSPLQLAAIYGRSKACKVIIKHVCEYNYIIKYLIVKADKNERTVLHLAAENGLSEVCEDVMRIAKKYSHDIIKELILKCDAKKRSALHLAAWKGHSNVCDMLLKTANEYIDLFSELITICDINERTPLHRAAANGHGEVCNTIFKAAEAYPDIVEYLITKCDNYKRTALHLAAQNGLSDICDDLIKNAKKYNLIRNVLNRDINEETALDLAAWNGHVDICENFLRLVKNENELLRDLLLNGNRTPLHSAAFNYHSKICETILKADFSILTDLLNKTDENNNTALHMAAMNGDCKVFEVIMSTAKEHNIKGFITKCDFANRTALQVAAKRGHSEFCDLLLKTVECYPDIVKYLLTKADWNRYNPLQIAVRNGYAKTCEVILKNAAKFSEVYAEIVTREDKYKRNAFVLAQEKGHDSVRHLILQNINDNNDMLLSSTKFTSAKTFKQRAIRAPHLVISASRATRNECSEPDG